MLLPVGNLQAVRGCLCLYVLPGAGDEEASMPVAAGFMTKQSLLLKMKTETLLVLP